MIIINHFYYLYVYGFMEPKKWGSAGVWGEVQRPSGAGSAASPQAAQKGCVKRFLRWTGL